MSLGDSRSERIDHELWPTEFLKDPWAQGENLKSAKDTTALIVLNSPLLDYTYFSTLHSHASFTLCADGGANRLQTLLTTTFPCLPQTEALSKALPNLIHGDLDSLAPEVRQLYEALGVQVTRDPDQYSTDFGKAVAQVLSHRPGVRDILVTGSLGGRVDQGIGLLHEFYREQVYRHPSSKLRFWLFSEASVTFLLGPGRTRMHFPKGERVVTENVGILPVFGKAVIGTRGLEWDVQGWETEMGGMLSTSNHVVKEVVEVETGREVLFTVERQNR